MLMQTVYLQSLCSLASLFVHPGNDHAKLDCPSRTHPSNAEAKLGKLSPIQPGNAYAKHMLYLAALQLSGWHY